MEKKNILKIVVASPGDVQTERDMLPDILKELNKGVADIYKLRLELYRWEVDSYPGFHLNGHQGVIDEALRIQECDIFIGIFWTRLGTKLKEGLTGTEHEFAIAYETWKSNKKPHIMFYFKEKPYFPNSSDEADQWKSVLMFRENFPNEGLFDSFKEDGEFQHKCRTHLTKYIRDLQDKLFPNNNEINNDNDQTYYWLSETKKYNKDLVEDWNNLSRSWNEILKAWDYCLMFVRQNEIHDNNITTYDIDRYHRYAALFAYNLRYFLSGRGYWQLAFERMPLSLEAAMKIQDKELVYRIRRHFALILRKMGKLDEAAQHHRINTEFAFQHRNWEWIGSELEKLGRVRKRQGLYSEAEYLYIGAFAIACSLGTEGERREAQCLNCLAELYRVQGNYDKAINIFEKALNLYDKLSDGQGVCSTLGHLGSTYSCIDEYNKSIKYYARAIDKVNRYGRTELEGSLYQDFGVATENLSQDITALASYVVAVEVSNNLGIQGWSGKSTVHLRDKLFMKLGSVANEYRITDDNSAEAVFIRAKDHVQMVVNSILAFGKFHHVDVKNE